MARSNHSLILYKSSLYFPLEFVLVLAITSISLGLNETKAVIICMKRPLEYNDSNQDKHQRPNSKGPEAKCLEAKYPAYAKEMVHGVFSKVDF